VKDLRPNLVENVRKLPLHRIGLQLPVATCLSSMSVAAFTLSLLLAVAPLQLRNSAHAWISGPLPFLSSEAIHRPQFSRCCDGQNQQARFGIRRDTACIRLYYGNNADNETASNNRPNDSATNQLFDATNSRLVGLNELHTVLRDAVAQEDYATAGQVSAELATRIFDDYATLSPTQQRARRRDMSWSGLGGAPWLVDRLDALNFTFPTTIQINSFMAVNAILRDAAANKQSIELDSGSTMSLEERVSRATVQGGMEMGIVVSGTTGSGKTLSYAVPLLSTLSDSLFVRQRLRISDEEAVGDTMGDLVDRISVVTSPRLTSNSRKPINSKGAIATGASIATLGRSGTDITSPLALVVVPTRELGVQTAMLLYQLVGGSLKESATAQSGRANMFKYKGPKGIRIGCVLDDDEASFGLKLQTDIAITTPQYLSKLLHDGDVDPSKLRVFVYDEADLALEQTTSHDLDRLFAADATEREFTRLTLLVGASVTEALGNLAVSSRILPSGKSYIATATSFAPLQSEAAARIDTAGDATDDNVLVGTRPKSASLQDLNVCLYPDLTHERVLVSQDQSGLLILTRLLRKELQDYERAVAQDPTSSKAVQRPRVVVFFPDEAQAKAAIEPLRDALWGDHRLCVLLPKTGFSPMTIMEQFKRNDTTVMLATPNSVRGLDFPALSHVYTLYLPMDDPREYLHLAGRVGRVGHRAKGHVVSVLKQDEGSKMDELAKLLGFEIVDVEAPTAESLLTRNSDGEIDETAIDYEKLRRAFEDSISFVEMAEEPALPDPASIKSNTLEDDDEDDDEVDEDDESESSFQ
jgi:superfamily II DNA/RNA helicase